MIGGQTMIVFVGGAAFSVERIDGIQWAISIVLGFLSLLVGVVVRLIPDELILKCIPAFFHRKRNPEVVVSDEDFEWNQGLLEIRDELAFMRKFRGGRLSDIKYKVQHPKEIFMSRSSQSLPGTPSNGPANDDGSPAPPTPSSRRRRSRSNSAFGPAAAMAGIVAGSIAGWSPIGKDVGDNGSIKFGRNAGKDDLEAQEGIELHPDTSSTAPILAPPAQEYRGPPSQNMETTPQFNIGPFAGDPNLNQSSGRSDKA